MALMNCPGCCGTVSRRAETCPHCGHPLRAVTVRPRGVWPKFIGALLLIFGLSYGMASAVLYSWGMPVFLGSVLGGLALFSYGRMQQ